MVQSVNYLIYHPVYKRMWDTEMYIKVCLTNNPKATDLTKTTFIIAYQREKQQNNTHKTLEKENFAFLLNNQTANQQIISVCYWIKRDVLP